MKRSFLPKSAPVWVLVNLIFIFSGYCSLLRAQSATGNLHEYWDRIYSDRSWQYDYLRPVNDSFALIRNDNRMGVINTTGKEILAIVYSSVKITPHHQLLLVKHEKLGYGLFKPDGTAVIPIQSSYIRTLPDGFCLTDKSGAFQYYDRSGSLIQVPVWKQKAESIQGAYYSQSQDDGLYGLKNITNQQWVIQPEYDFLTPIKNDYWAAKSGSQTFVLNPAKQKRSQKGHNDIYSADDTGYWASDDIFDSILDYDYENPYYRYDWAGNRIATPYKIYNYGDGWVVTQAANEKKGITDPDFNTILEPVYDNVYVEDTRQEGYDWLLFFASNGSYCGVHDGKKWIVPLKKQQVALRDYVKLVILTADSCSIYDLNSQKSISFPMEYPEISGNCIYSRLKKDKIYDIRHGWMNFTGKFDAINQDEYHSYCISVKTESGRVDILNQRGELLLSGCDNVVDRFLPNRRFIYKRNNRYGVYSLTQGHLLAPEYDHIIVANDSTFLVNSGQQWSVVGVSGEALIPLKFDQCNGVSDYEDFIFLQKGSFWHVFTKTLKSIGPDQILECKYVNALGLEYVWVKTSMGWWLYDRDGALAIPFHTTQAQLLRIQQKQAAIQDAQNKWGVVDLATGKTVLPFEWDEIRRFWCERILLRKGRQMVILNMNYQQLFQFEADNCQQMGRKFLVKRQDNYYLIDLLRQPVFDRPYQSVANFYAEGAEYLCRRDHHFWDLVDRNGAILLTVDADTLWRIGDNHLGFIKDGKKWLYQLTTRKIYPNPYDKVKPFASLYFVTRDSVSGVLDANWNAILPVQYSYAALDHWAGSYLTIEGDRIWGMYTLDGKVCIPPDHYAYCTGVSYDLVVAEHDSTAGVYSKVLQKWIPATKWEHIEFFCNWGPTAHQLFKVTLKGKFGLIDAELKPFLDPVYSKLVAIENDKYVAAGFKDGHWYLIDGKGRPGEAFTYVNIDQRGRVTMTKNNKTFVLDRSGEVKPE